MVEGERHQRDFDHEPGQDQAQEGAERPHGQNFLARRKQVAHRPPVVKRNDRGDGGETHLKACAADRLRPEQQDDQRTDGNQPEAHRFPPQGNSPKDQHRRDAGPYRRHLHASQQRVGDTRGRAETGRYQDQVESQGEPFAQGQQFQ